jgi:hypothetical protein
VTDLDPAPPGPVAALPAELALLPLDALAEPPELFGAPLPQPAAVSAINVIVVIPSSPLRACLPTSSPSAGIAT